VVTRPNVGVDRPSLEVVEVSDVIIQVLDARDPLACRSPEVERLVRRTNPDKRVVLLLNKIDLAPKAGPSLGLQSKVPRFDSRSRWSAPPFCARACPRFESRHFSCFIPQSIGR